MTKIYCSQCPIRDLCATPRRHIDSDRSGEEIRFYEDSPIILRDICPLYKTMEEA
jgi:hypothetical protein